MKPTTFVRSVNLLLLAVISASILVQCGPGGAATTVAPKPNAAAATPESGRHTPVPEKIDGFLVIARTELPAEALETIRLIEQGGPFPYRQDGAVFQNRERLLPRQPRGYYHEYTVVTPGESDRGARRVVTGEDGEMYYTDDHYTSFERIAP